VLEDFVIERSKTNGDMCRDRGMSVLDMLLTRGAVTGGPWRRVRRGLGHRLLINYDGGGSSSPYGLIYLVILYRNFIK
jgi:hypothetical protein